MRFSVVCAALAVLMISFHQLWEPHIPLKVKVNHFVLQLVARGFISREMLEALVPTVGVTYPLYEGGVRSSEHRDAHGTLRFRMYEARGSGAAADTLVYVHGGGFVLGHVRDTHNDLVCRQLAAAGPVRVLAVEYRKSPEHAVNAGHQDVLYAYRWARQQLRHSPSARLALGGASAGATLALSACLQVVAEGEPVHHLLLVYPALQHGFQLHEHHWILSGALIRWFRSQHVEPVVDEHTRVLENLLRVPGGHTQALQRLPPVHLVSAGMDPLVLGAQKLDAELRAARVPLKHSHYPTSVHGFFSFHIEETEEAIRDAAASLFRIA